MSETADLAELLLEGARYGDLEDCQQALDQGAKVDSRDSQGRTALHMASGNGHLEITQVLLKGGAEATAANDDGNTPLHYACLNGHLEVAQELLQHGASPSQLNRHLRTPVDEALGKQHQDALFRLLAATQKENQCASSEVVLDPDADLTIPSKYGDSGPDQYGA
ncbi:hypothetical protein WJX73_002227 [Symbiochloris irregularis]|uniref:Uncharacterized protein n=1 Tax=Symbiochloris irregularis TaxID=706552 RepID=A0AAW1PZA4_9CHLO